MKDDRPSRFGPYEIIGSLGAGGMGEVYRARDTRLQRDVALKILPQAAASNPDRQRRFAQEAIAASALNHPNILAVYDVGVEGDAPYLVSELIEGVSLRREMERGRLALKRWLDIGVQIADGLSAAHEAGIVHRDVKPDNVMITRDGRVKILDFGLAKTTEVEGEAVVAPSAMTQTAAGLLVGTIPYMSPEQARGGRVDFRSDQFSLGLVLYEMATGTHPFLRETAVQTLSAIIADEPKPLAPLNAACPAPLRWTIERLLAKDPHHRYASTLDLAADLRTIRDRLAKAAASVAADPAPPRRMWLRRSVLAAALLAAFVLGGVAWPPAATDDVAQSKFTPLATDAGYQGAPAWSPDGKTLAYVAEVDGVLQVFTRGRDSSMRVQLTRQRSDCHEPFWAPDGTIYYHALAGSRESLWRISVAGGEADMVIEGATRAAMAPDGKTLAVLRDDSSASVALTLWFSSPPGADPKPFTRLPYEHYADGVLRYSPDGTKLLMWLMQATVGAKEIENATGFWIMSPSGSDPKPIVPALSGPRAPALFSWLPDSRHIVVVRNDGVTPGSHLWLADTESGSTRPLTVTNGNEGFPAVSPDGKEVAFTSEATDFDLLLLPIDGTPPRPFLSSTRNELDPAWSPVAPEYAFVTDRTGGPEIWLRNEDGTFEARLVTDRDFGSSRTIALGALAFAPNGQRLAYQRYATDGGYRVWISTRAGGSAVRLSEDDRYQDAPTWSPDGNWIAFNLGTPAQTLAKLPVGGRSTAPIVLKEDVIPFTRPQWSPDGNWILCETGDGLALVSADGKRSHVVSADVWIAYAWNADGSRIVGLRRTDDQHHFMLVSIDPATGTERVINANFGTVPQANQPIRGLSRVRASAFLTSIARARSDVFLLEGFSTPRSFLGRFWRR